MTRKKKGKNTRKFKSNRRRVQERAKNRDKGGIPYLRLPEGTDIFEPKAKTYELSIIPYLVESEVNPDCEPGYLDYRRKIFVHHDIGPDGTSVLCRRTIGEPCPICEYRNTLSWDDDEDEMRQLRAQEREIYNIIDLNKDEDEVLIAIISYGNFGELLDDEIAAADHDDPILGIADLEDRPHLEVRFKKEKFNKSTYFSAAKITAVEGDDLDMDFIEENAVDLDEILIVKSYDELQDMLQGVSSSGDDEDDDERPRKKKKTGKKSRKARYHHDDDEDEDDVPMNTGDDDEDEKPRKKSRKKKKAGKKKTKRECPHGYEYGQDADEYEECDECPLWDLCVENMD